MTPEKKQVNQSIKKVEKPKIHLPMPNFGGGAQNLTQYIQN